MRVSNVLFATAAVLMTSSTIAAAQSTGSMYFGGHAGLNLTVTLTLPNLLFFMAIRQHSKPATRSVDLSVTTLEPAYASRES